MMHKAFIEARTVGQCSVPGCTRKLKALGWCMTHYKRASRDGILGMTPEEAKFHTWSVNLRSQYNITLAQHQALWESQGRCCPLCGLEGPDEAPRSRLWNIDHDHSCCPQSVGTCGLCIRGILCRPCNTSLNYKIQDPEWLKRAMLYIGAVVVHSR